ncbi:Glycerol-3-phosphate acyltransferase [Candidatus Phytoplasma solani]|nr:Glycerol-3-phosphate acyltransferase [Candidatus Phytoplasma solani]
MYFDSDALFFIALFFLFYLIGSIPVGLIIGKWVQKKDLRIVGSGNIGATNASRILGKKWGLLVFLCDFLKGFIPAVVCLKNEKIKNICILLINKDIFISLLCIAAILGHMFSVFNGFKGGKAIASSVGVITAINPYIGLLGIVFFLIILRLSGYASLASIIATLLVNLLLWLLLLKGNKDDNISILPLYLCIGLITFLVIAKHYPNIIRLWQGTENKFHFQNKKK